MKEYFQKMLSASDETSHKRFISLVAFVVLIGMVVAKFFGLQLDNNLIYVFASLVAGQSALTVVDKIFGKTSTDEKA